MLVPFGVAPDRAAGADAVLTVTGHRWSGLGVGRGLIRARELDVESRLHGQRQKLTLSFAPDEISVTTPDTWVCKNKGVTPLLEE